MLLSPDRLYTPSEIISLAQNTSEFLPSKQKQQLSEAYAVALMALAIDHDQENSLLKIVDNDIEHTPDVRLLKDTTSKRARYQDIEVVKFTRYSEAEGFVKFLLRTKLAPVNAYPAEMVLLCHIDVPLTDPTFAARRLSGAFAKYATLRQRIKNPLFVVLRGKNDIQQYIFRVYPFYEPLGQIPA